MELKEIVGLYRRWIGLLIAGLVLGLACGFLASKIQTPVYQSAAKVLISRNRQQSGADILALSDQQLVATYQQLLKTQSILEQAVSQTGSKIDPNRVQVDILTNTQIIQITVEDRQPAQAATIANTLVQILIQQNEALQGGRYASYQEGLNSQITQVQKQIADLQGQITQLDQANIQEQLTQVGRQITSIQAEMVDLQKEIAQSPQALSTVARASLAEKQAQLNQLGALLSLYQQIQANLTYIGKPVQGGSSPTDPQVAGLESTLSLYQQLYLNLLNNLEAVKLARVQSTPTVTLIEAAAPAKAPIRPSPLMYTLLAGLVGLLLAAGAILLINYFDDTISTAQKAQELLHAPVIGEVAEFGAMSGKRHQWQARTNHRDSAQEDAFGSIRINLSKLLARSPAKTLLVTSAWRGEGKTTVCANLARSFAQAGKRVILVDADLVRPQLHQQFGLENQMGLADVLSGGVDWQEVSSVQDKITILTSGSAPAGTSGLFETEKMSDLLERLQGKADIVIVDSPPFFVPEAQALASQLGGVLLVIQQGQTKISIAHSVKGQLELLGAPLLGIVLNRVPGSEAYYFQAVPEKVLNQKPPEKVEQAETA